MFEIRQDFWDHRFYGIPSHFWHIISRQMLGNGLHQFIFTAGKIVLVNYIYKNCQYQDIIFPIINFGGEFGK